MSPPSIILAGVYGIWIITRIVYGKTRNNKEIYTNDITRKEFYLLSLLTIISLIIGIVPGIISKQLTIAISMLM